MQADGDMLVVLFRFLIGYRWATQMKMASGECGLQRTNYKGGGQGPLQLVQGGAQA